MLKNALGFRQFAAVVLALAANASGAETTTVQHFGTHIDRTAEGVTANAEASRAVQAARAANAQAESSEKARLDAACTPEERGQAEGKPAGRSQP